MLNSKCDKLTSILGQAQQSLRDYESAIENMRVHLDKARVIKSKNRDLKYHLKIMRDNEDSLLRTVADQRRQLNPEKEMSRLPSSIRVFRSQGTVRG